MLLVPLILCSDLKVKAETYPCVWTYPLSPQPKPWPQPKPKPKPKST